MAILKCKMCGGDLSVTESIKIVECDFCGTTQTVPHADDEKKTNLFNRANRLRIASEFDRAAGIYESIIAEFPNESEAYWGLCLCKYGIEYVDDPRTAEKIPTCHRTSFESIFNDSNFNQAISYSDPVAKGVYEREAKAIDALQKDILSIVNKEKPFDVFICYKESDNNGRRTPDSVLAQELFYQLKQEGLKVFFARITLEDKLGSAYEPYIFAALNSAKVMVVLGTKPEFFQAVWVKNEWARYLSLIKQGQKKALIPAYKDMDPYDLPEEFSRLQAQDMSKLGFMQDLIRGIHKLTQEDTPTAATVVKETVIQSGSTNAAALLKRAFMFLEDGDWNSADDYCEKVLDNDPENAQAYLGKTLAQAKCRTLDAFVHKRIPFNIDKEATLYLEPNKEYIESKVSQFILKGYVDEKEIRTLYDCDLSYHSQVAYRNRQYRDEEAYWRNHKLLAKAEKYATGTFAEKLQKAKRTLFDVLADWVKNAEKEETAEKNALRERYAIHLKQADEQAEKLYSDGLAQREKHYQQLLQIANSSGNVDELKATAKKIALLGEYQDSQKMAEYCLKRAAEVQAKIDAKNEQKRLIQEKQEKARQARNKIIAIISSSVAIIAIAVVVIVTKVIIPSNNYDQAMALFENGQYEEAIAAFEAMNGYKDSLEKIEECKYEILDNTYDTACVLMTERKYNEAIVILETLTGHRDSAAKIEEAKLGITDGKYNDAVMLIGEGKYNEAIAILETLNGYRDSTAKIEEAELGITDRNYNNAVKLITEGKYNEAIAILETLNGHRDSAAKIEEAKQGIIDDKYNDALALLNGGKYDEAISAFSALSGYKDSLAKILEAKLMILKSADIGDIVEFGNYEQDRNMSNGAEPIQWIVVEKKDGNIVLLSEKSLKLMAFDTNGSNNWNDSTLRKWLNDEFIVSAFSLEEQRKLQTTSWGKVYLLSADEIETYDRVNPKRLDIAKITAAGNADPYESYRDWWTLSPVLTFGRPEVVTFGETGYRGSTDSTWRGIGVRPAISIEISN